MRKRSAGSCRVPRSTGPGSHSDGDGGLPQRLPPRSSIGLAVLCASASLAAPPVAVAEIEEVLVTATRRESSTQDVPYNVSALGKL